MIRTALIALVLLSAPARAEITGWTLAVTWQPGFCALNARSKQCGSEPQPGLALHGLWTEGMGDEFCGVPQNIRAQDKARQWCELPLPKLKSATQKTLNRAMPGTADCLEHHEWTKHGTCSSMEADAYFSVAAELLDAVNRMQMSRVLKDRAGGSIMLAELDAAITQDLGVEGARAVLPVCSRGKGEVRLLEIRISLDAAKYRDFPKPGALLPREKWLDPRCPMDRPIGLGAR